MHKIIQNNTKKSPKIKKVFDFYIFSNIHVAIATYCLTKITLLEIGITESKTASFVFLSTLLSYNLIRFVRLNTIKNWYNNWITKNTKALYFISAIGLLGTLYYSIQLRFKAILTLIPFALATIFYVIPIKKKSLRKIARLKIFLIAISWAGITVLFPLIQNYMTIRITDWITFIQRILIVIIITLPFDIRDIEYDAKELKTLPQQIGIKKTKIIGILLLISFLILELFKSEKTIINLLIIAIISGTLLIKATKKQTKYYSAFFVEAIPILWYILVMV